MRKSEVKRVKPEPNQKEQSDPNLDARNKGKETKPEPAPFDQEVPIIQRYSE